MFADADHEVIDSPEALFRHLYEEHGVEEARDLDPETAPLQFWLRRHADLERAQRAARRQAEPPAEPEPPADREPPAEPEPAPRARPEPRPRGEPGPPAPSRPQPQPAARSRPEPRPQAPFQPEPRSRPDPRPQPPPPPGAERRHARFGDPLVEAVARALAGRGHDEAAVRSAIRSFDGGPGGEAGVRAVFVEPMLQSAAERLLGAGGARRPAARAQPAPAAPPPQPSRPAAPGGPAPEEPARPAAGTDRAPAAPEEAARPEAAWAVLWSDLADPGRRPAAGAGTADDDGDDLMAVANAVQTRRRSRRRRR
jgi:outer membrane biosynthesis protein TonB